MNITEGNIAVCQQALYLLRQDVGLPSVDGADSDDSLEWRKCRIAFDAALAETWNAHDWLDSWGVKATDADAATLPLECDKWPEDAKSALAYGVAKELAIPLAGRMDDLKTWTSLWQDKLEKARVSALEAERKSVADPIHVDLLAQMMPRFSSGNLPRSVKTILDRADALKDEARTAVLTAQAWNFARAEEPTPGCPLPHGAGDYRFASSLPPFCARLLAVYSDDGRIDEWKVMGRTVVATRPVRSAAFVRDDRRPEKWPPLVRRCFVLRLAASVAQTEIPDLQPTLEQRYAQALSDAKVTDARENFAPSEIAGRNHYVDAMQGRVRPPDAAPRLPRFSFDGLV